MNSKNVDQNTKTLKHSTSFCLVLLLSIIFIIPCVGQSAIYLQHREKPNRHKKISLKRVYKFETSDTTIYRHRIVSLERDTIILSSEHTSALIKIDINDVYFLEKEKKYGAFETIGTLGMISLTITPIIWATEGNEAALGMLEVSGVFLACSVPFLALKEVGRKKNTRDKWKICIS